MSPDIVVLVTLWVDCHFAWVLQTELRIRAVEYMTFPKAYFNSLLVPEVLWPQYSHSVNVMRTILALNVSVRSFLLSPYGNQVVSSA